MHDLRRRALESHKTLSKKAQARLVTSSRSSSAANSRTHSRTASRNPSDDEEEGSHGGSTNWSGSSSDDMSIGEDPEELSQAWVQELGDRIEEIVDRKRSSVQDRETSIAQYVQLLTRHYCPDEIQRKTSELLPALLRSIKSESSEKEATLALRAVALTILTIPSDSIYDSIFQAIKAAYSTSESHSIRVVAIHTLSIAAAYGGASDSEIEEIMDDFLDIVESDGVSIGAEDSGEVVTAACQAWGFLATKVDDLEEKTEASMDAFVEQLDSTDPEVQIAAGENIALLYESGYDAREEAGIPAIEERQEPHEVHVVKRYDIYRQEDQLKHKLSQLASDSSRRVSRQERKSLRTNFTDILSSLDASRGPRYSTAIDDQTGLEYGSRMKFKIRNQHMLVDKWWKLHRIQALTRIMGGGLIHHYQANPAIRDSLPELENIQRKRRK